MNEIQMYGNIGCYLSEDNIMSFQIGSNPVWSLLTGIRPCFAHRGSMSEIIKSLPVDTIIDSVKTWSGI